MNPVLTASLSVGTRSGMIIHKEKNGYYTIWFLMCVCFYFYRIKSSWKWRRRDSKLFLFNADQCGWVECNTTFAREQFVWTVITILIWGVCRKCYHLETSSNCNGDLKAIIAQKGVGNFWISLNVVPGIFPGKELVVTAFKFTGPWGVKLVVF